MTSTKRLYLAPDAPGVYESDHYLVMDKVGSDSAVKILASDFLHEVVAARDAYPSLDARLDALVLAGGNVATKANGVSAAGQKVLTVDATDGFIVGAYVTYLLNDTTLEGNTIASIQAGVSLTLGTNIGTGGVLDDSYISMISISEYQAAQAIPHAGTLMLPQTMEYANGGVFKASAYGASPSASAAVNDAAILAAGTAASAVGGIVEFDPGTFSISSIFNIDSFVTVGGAGPATILKWEGVGTAATVFKATDKTNVTIRDLTIDGGAQSGIVYGAAVFFLRCTNCQALNVRVLGSNGCGVMMQGCVEGLISGCSIYHTGSGGIDVADSERISVIGNYVHGCIEEGIRAYGSTAVAGACSDITIVGNVTNGNAIGCIVGGNSATNPSRYITVTGNVFDSPTNVGMTIAGGSQCVTVANNIIRTPGSAGIYCRPTINTTEWMRISITGNIIYDGLYEGIAIYATYQSMKDCLIANNIISGMGGQGIAIRANCATAGTTISKVDVSGNNISNCTGPAIYAYADAVDCALEGINIHSNICYDDQTPKTQTYGVYLYRDNGKSGTSVSYCRVENNIVTGNATAGIGYQYIGTANNLIRNNAGYLTANSGLSAAISTGGTIAHGLVGTPNKISLTASAADAGHVYVTADATNLTVTFDGGSTKAFYWTAEIVV